VLQSNNNNRAWDASTTTMMLENTMQHLEDFYQQVKIRIYAVGSPDSTLSTVAINWLVVRFLFVAGSS